MAPGGKRVAARGADLSLSGGHNAINNRRGGELPGHKVDGCR